MLLLVLRLPVVSLRSFKLELTRSAGLRLEFWLFPGADRTLWATLIFIIGSCLLRGARLPPQTGLPDPAKRTSRDASRRIVVESEPISASCSFEAEV